MSDVSAKLLPAQTFLLCSKALWTPCHNLQNIQPSLQWGPSKSWSQGFSWVAFPFAARGHWPSWASPTVSSEVPQWLWHPSGQQTRLGPLQFIISIYPAMFQNTCNPKRRKGCRKGNGTELNRTSSSCSKLGQRLNAALFHHLPLLPCLKEGQVEFGYSQEGATQLLSLLQLSSPSRWIDP